MIKVIQNYLYVGVRGLNERGLWILVEVFSGRPTECALAA